MNECIDEWYLINKYLNIHRKPRTDFGNKEYLVEVQLNNIFTREIVLSIIHLLFIMGKARIWQTGRFMAPEKQSSHKTIYLNISSHHSS